MTTAILFEATRSTADGKRFAFTAWCERKDRMAPEDGRATIEVTEAGAPKDIPGWKLSVCLDELKDKWAERWVEAFCTQPDYRAQFACDAAGVGGVHIPREVNHPKTGDIKTQTTLPAIPVLPALEAAQKKSHAVKSFLALGPAAKFSDYAQLRSGRDAFSTMKIEALKEMMGPEQSTSLMALNVDEENRVRVARWVMRGLSIEDAARKIEVDMEVAEHAHGNKHVRQGPKP
jgi:hypothetical protein